MLEGTTANVLMSGPGHRRDTALPGQAGVLSLPSGRLIRGRGLLTTFPGGPRPEFGLYLGKPGTWLFVIAMLVGMAAHELLQAAFSRRGRVA